MDGAAARPGLALRGGEQVEIHVPPAPPSELISQDLGLPILHIDEHLLVVDKPAGMVVHPARGHPDGTLVNAVLHLLRTGEGAPGAPERPGIVHRLDAGTSGILVVARDAATHEGLARQFAAHSVDRRYAALVWGRPLTATGTIDAPLARHPRDRLRFAIVEGGRHAITHWRLRASVPLGASGDPGGEPVSLLLCKLETGRTHQIRVHLSAQGLPLLGDPLYGRSGRVHGRLRTALEGVDHQLLHAFRLGFTHPVTGERLRFERPVPPDYQAVLDCLGMPDPVASPGS